MRDWRGTPIEVGRRIVYPVRMFSSMWMTEAVVTAVREADPPHLEVDFYRDSESFRKRTQMTSKIRNVRQVTVVA